jgi:hypothetical protein
MRQWIRSHLTYANVMATLAVFLVLGGGTALASYVVSSNEQVGPGTISDHDPPSGKHANLIAGSITGKDVAGNALGGGAINEASLTGDATRIDYNAPPNGDTTAITKAGPYILKDRCNRPSNSNTVIVTLLAYGPDGTMDSMWSTTANDNSDLGNGSVGKHVLANTDTQIAGVAGPGVAGYGRVGGRALLRSGGVLVQVDFEATADTGGQDCWIYGTATRATG